MVTLSHLDEKLKKIKYLEIIKTLETNLQFEMSFQQQLHRVVFMLLYCDLRYSLRIGGCVHIFLVRGRGLNLIEHDIYFGNLETTLK